MAGYRYNSEISASGNLMLELWFYRAKTLKASSCAPLHII